MNLALRGIEANLGPHHADTFRNDLHKDLRADFILANPPFNVSDWRGELLREDKRWKYGVPPAGNANFAWVQHIVHHLAPAGVAGFVLANGSMSSNQSGEGEIRKSLIEADLVDCMVALPGQLFYSTQIPACLWFLSRNKAGQPPSPRRGGHPSPSGRGERGEGEPAERLRDRRGEVLFLDARKMGRLVGRTQRELTDEDIARVASTYHLWRASPHPASGHPLPVGEGRGEGVAVYRDTPRFRKRAAVEELRTHGHVLTPGRYVGTEAQEDYAEPFEEKMKRLTATLRQQQKKAAKLDAAIAANLEELGYGG